MADLRCADGAVLGVHAEPVRDRDGAPYEVTLRLTRDGEPFGEVGERCGYFLAATASRLRAVRRDDPEGFPRSSAEAGVRAWARDVAVDQDAAWDTLARYLPRDRELFAFRSRDPDDLASVGELRARLEVVKQWSGASGSEPGSWRLQCCAVLEAWGAGGVGLRCVLSSEALQEFLDQLMQDFADVGAAYDPDEDAAALRRPVG